MEVVVVVENVGGKWDQPVECGAKTVCEDVP